MSEYTPCPRCAYQNSSLEEQGPEFCPQCQFPLMLIAGKYRLVREIAEGGFGRVYEAVHTGLPHAPRRAVKIIRPEILEKPHAAKRFDREVRVTSMLAQSTPHVVQVFDDIGDVPNLGRYYVMEYLEGQMLQEYAESRGGTLTFSECAGVMAQLFDALQVCHDAGIVHRDLKPENVFLLPRPDGSHLVKLIDFGIAKPLSWTTQAITQGAIGTPLYMSPEQCMGKKVGPATDIYALGVILFELLVGYTPFGPKTEAEMAHCTPLQIIFGHVETPVPKLAEVRPDLTFPSGLQEVLGCAMHKQAEGRFPTVRAFDEALRDVAQLADPGSHVPTLAIDVNPGQATLVEPVVYPSSPALPATPVLPSSPALPASPPLPTPTVLPTPTALPTVSESLSQLPTLLTAPAEERPTAEQQVHSFGYEEMPAPRKSLVPLVSGVAVGVLLLVLILWASGLFRTSTQAPSAPITKARTQKRGVHPRRTLPRRGVRPQAPRAPRRTKASRTLRRLPECSQAPLRWTLLAIPAKALARLKVHHTKGGGKHHRKKVGVCVGVKTPGSTLRLDGKGIIPCTIQPWKLAARVPIFLQFEGGGLEPSAPDYCLKPGE